MLVLVLAAVLFVSGCIFYGVGENSETKLEKLKIVGYTYFVLTAATPIICAILNV